MKPATWIACLLLASSAVAGEIQVEPAGAVLHVTAGGQPVCDYQMQPGAVPPGMPDVFRHGAHLHPVFTPSGKLITADHPEDHPWQRGIWLAWTDTEFGEAHPDFWNQGKGGQLTAEVRFDALIKTWNGPEGGFVSTHRFLDRERDVLKETWQVTVSQRTLDGRLANVIDLTSTQTCASDLPLKLPKYHYGGLGVRGNAAWNPVDAVTMLTSEGLDRTKGDSTKGKWVAMGGQVDGTPAGLAVLIHPENFRFPQPLRLNPKNPQFCIAPSQDGDWSIEPGKPYISRYRILIFDGAIDGKWIESAWGDYAAGR
jgi:hypothetical protein